jgi:hypothetical protein
MAATIMVKVEVKFDGTDFNDITRFVDHVQLSYGRARLLDEFSSGGMSLYCDNTGGEFTPGHPGSAYGDSQLINREVRVSSEVVGGSDAFATYLFRGVITDVNYAAGHNTSEVEFVVSDGFERLATASILNQTFAEQYTGVRAEAILDLATVDYPDGVGDREMDLGFAKAVSASGVTATALDYLQKLTRTESGRFLVNHAGTPSSTNHAGVLSFYARNAETDDHGIIISDSVTLSTGSAQAEDLELEWGSELLFNAFEFTDAAGGVQTGTSSTSITKYGQRTIKRTLLSDATYTDEAGDYFIGLYDEPALRVSKVIVQVDSATTATCERLLHLHVNSALSLSYLPPGSSTTLSGAYIVEGVTLDITVRDMATNAASIKAIYSTSSADQTGYWVLGDAVLSTLPTVLAPTWIDTGSFRLDDPPRNVLPVSLG